MAKQKESKSAEIRKYLAEFPDASVKDVAGAVGCTERLMYAARDYMSQRAKSKPKSKSAAPVKAAPKVASTDLSDLLKTNEFVRTVGGFKRAEELIATLAAIKATFAT